MTSKLLNLSGLSVEEKLEKLSEFKAGKSVTGSIITPPFRVSFASVFEKKFSPMDKKELYRIALLFPKKTDMSVLKGALKDTADERWGNKPPKGLRNPIRDGDEKELQGYEDCFFINLKSKEQPDVLNVDGTEIFTSNASDPDSFYSGCWAQASISCYAYPKENSGASYTPGVAFGLKNLRKVADDEAFSGKTRGADDFGLKNTASEDASNYEGDDSSDPFDN